MKHFILMAIFKINSFAVLASSPASGGVDITRAVPSKSFIRAKDRTAINQSLVVGFLRYT